MQATTDMAPTPLVTIMVITYNHERFIRRTIESVLKQRTSFNFKIHVIEDCSTDGTQEILRELKARYPDKIELFLNKVNIGRRVTQKNFIRGFKTLKSPYIAVLEGDDYWGYTGKLEEQVRFLQENPNFSACGHNTVKFSNEEIFLSHVFLKPQTHRRDYHAEDFICINIFFHTSSLMYRNVLLNRVPKEFENPFSCDIFITIAHATYGPVFYMDKNWSYYRQHAGGMFSNGRGVGLEGWIFNIDGLRRYNQWLGYRYMYPFSRSVLKYALHVFKQAATQQVRVPAFVLIKLVILSGIYGLICSICVIPRLTAAYIRGNLFRSRKPLDLNLLSLN